MPTCSSRFLGEASFVRRLLQGSLVRVLSSSSVVKSAKISSRETVVKRVKPRKRGTTQARCQMSMDPWIGISIPNISDMLDLGALTPNFHPEFRRTLPGIASDPTRKFCCCRPETRGKKGRPRKESANPAYQSKRTSFIPSVRFFTLDLTEF